MVIVLILSLSGEPQIIATSQREDSVIVDYEEVFIRQHKKEYSESMGREEWSPSFNTIDLRESEANPFLTNEYDIITGTQLCSAPKILYGD